MMLNGERPAGCNYCWRVEDIGGRSDRVYRSGEYWAQNARTSIINALDFGDVDPRYVEINFNQACNFKCMYCSPHLSSTWEEDVEQHGHYTIIDQSGRPSGHNNLEYFKSQGMMPLKVKQEDNPYLDAFWKWWPTMYKSLDVLRLTGGEPLMDANTYRIMDYIHATPNAWLELSVTTNMCPPKPELMDKFISKVQKLEEVQVWNDPDRFNPGSGNNWYVNMALKNFALFVSVDSVGDHAEYMRNGLKFDLMQENVQRFLSDTNNTTLTFINTFSALSVPRIRQFLGYILELRKQYSKDKQGTKHIPVTDPRRPHPDYVIEPRQRIWFDLPILSFPSWQAVNILPSEFDQYLVDAIHFMKEHANTDNFDGFYDFEIAKLERNLSIMRSRNADDQNILIDRRNFVSFFDQYDARNSTNLVTTFPEFERIYNDWKMFDK